MKITVNNPTVPEAKTLTKEDVWGKFDEKTFTKLTNGMIRARTGDKCPIFKDIVPYKSVTVVCNASQVEEVVYWLEYVHGGGCVSKIEVLDDMPEDAVAIRSDYQCW